MDVFEEIYCSMLGSLVPGAKLPWVEDAFVEDGIRMNAYEDMRDAYERLCHRLGVTDEDEDLETMVSSLETIHTNS